MGDADFGFHDGKDGGPDVNVNRYTAKLGYELLDRRSGR